MYYYQFHIGDFRGATMHLSNDEELAYRRLLDWYYDTESPIPLETQMVSRRLRIGIESVASVLRDFFVETEKGWVHERCEIEISKYHNRTEKNRENGRKGGRPRAAAVLKENPVGFQSVPSGNPYESEQKPNQEPITNNQEPKSKSSCDQQAGSRERIDYECVFEAYARNLPKLPQVRIKDDARKRAIKTIVGMDKKFAEPDFFDRYFAYVEKSDFLMGRNERAWKGCCFDWLMKPANLKKIIEGNYHHA